MGCHYNIFYALILISYKKILGTLARNMARDFTEIFSQRKICIRAAGTAQ